MTEEEILINIKEMINICDSLPNEECTAHIISHDHFKAVKGLLDLYNKQKEEIEEEKEKWKELFHEYNKLVGEVINKEQDLKDSISKDKIRDKIKELEDYKKTLTHTKENEDVYLPQSYVIKQFKSLLEEN